MAFSGLGFQRLQRVARLVHYRGGHAGQARHLDTVALAGGARLNFVQKHNVAARLDGADMHVDGGVVFGRELGQLEVMGGEQGVGLRLVVQLGGNG